MGQLADGLLQPARSPVPNSIPAINFALDTLGDEALGANRRIDVSAPHARDHELPV